MASPFLMMFTQIKISSPSTCDVVQSFLNRHQHCENRDLKNVFIARLFVCFQSPVLQTTHILSQMWLIGLRPTVNGGLGFLPPPCWDPEAPPGEVVIQENIPPLLLIEVNKKTWNVGMGTVFPVSSPFPLKWDCCKPL